MPTIDREDCTTVQQQTTLGPPIRRLDMQNSRVTGFETPEFQAGLLEQEDMPAVGMLAMSNPLTRMPGLFTYMTSSDLRTLGARLTELADLVDASNDRPSHEVN